MFALVLHGGRRGGKQSRKVLEWHTRTHQYFILSTHTTEHSTRSVYECTCCCDCMLWVHAVSAVSLIACVLQRERCTRVDIQRDGRQGLRDTPGLLRRKISHVLNFVDCFQQAALFMCLVHLTCVPHTSQLCTIFSGVTIISKWLIKALCSCLSVHQQHVSSLQDCDFDAAIFCPNIATSTAPKAGKTNYAPSQW